MLTRGAGPGFVVAEALRRAGVLVDLLALTCVLLSGLRPPKPETPNLGDVSGFRGSGYLRFR